MLYRIEVTELPFPYDPPGDYYPTMLLGFPFFIVEGTIKSRLSSEGFTYLLVLVLMGLRPDYFLAVASWLKSLCALILLI